MCRRRVVPFARRAAGESCQGSREYVSYLARLMAADSPPPEANIKNILSNLTDEELAAARKQSLLRQYGYVEGGPEDEIMAREGPQRGDAAKTTEEKKAAEERRALIEAALKLDAKKKKYKKQQERKLHQSKG